MPDEIHPVGAETPGRAQGHGRMHAVAPGHVVGGGNHPPLATPHDDRFAPQRRIPILLDGGEERIEVEMSYDPVSGSRPDDALMALHAYSIDEQTFGGKGAGCAEGVSASQRSMHRHAVSRRSAETPSATQAYYHPAGVFSTQQGPPGQTRSLSVPLCPILGYALMRTMDTKGGLRYQQTLDHCGGVGRWLSSFPAVLRSLGTDRRDPSGLGHVQRAVGVCSPSAHLCRRERRRRPVGLAHLLGSVEVRDPRRRNGTAAAVLRPGGAGIHRPPPRIASGKRRPCGRWIRARGCGRSRRLMAHSLAGISRAFKRELAD